MNLDGTDKICGGNMLEYFDRKKAEFEAKVRRQQVEKETLEPEHRHRRGAPSVQQLENEDDEPYIEGEGNRKWLAAYNKYLEENSG